MKKGAALLIAVVVLAAFLLLGALFARIVYNGYAGTRSLTSRAQAFYLAEAGLEKGKVELAHNPNWFTDLPYYLSDNFTWLANYAVGDAANLGEGDYKVVREQGKRVLYAVGYKGKSVVVLKALFSGTPPRFSNWQEL